MPKPKGKAPKENRIFRPSILPKLEECVHYQPKDKQTPYAIRGNDLHSDIASVLKASMRGQAQAEAALQKVAAENRDTAEWAWLELTHNRFILIKGVEVALELKLDGKSVWKPTADGYGFDDEPMLWGWDHKSGDEREYAAQYAAYGWLLMEKLEQHKMIFAELLLDLRKVNEYEIDFTDAKDRVMSLWHDFSTPENRPYTINEYCEYCSLRGNGCPAWEQEADHAITVGSKLDASAAAVAALKRDPLRLGKFYVAYKRLVKLVEEEWGLKTAIHEHLQNGKEVPGCTLARDRSWTSCDIEKVLLEIVPLVGTNRAQTFLEVHATKMQEVWAAFTSEPFPSEKVKLTTSSPDTYHVRVAGPPGRGKAAAARKERQLAYGH